MTFHSVTYEQDNVTFDQLCRRERSQHAPSYDPTGGRDHCQEGSEDSFGFLDLVPVDEGVEEGDGNEDPTEVGVLEVVLQKVSDSKEA